MPAGPLNFPVWRTCPEMVAGWKTRARGVGARGHPSWHGSSSPVLVVVYEKHRVWTVVGSGFKVFARAHFGPNRIHTAEKGEHSREHRSRQPISILRTEDSARLPGGPGSIGKRAESSVRKME